MNIILSIFLAISTVILICLSYIVYNCQNKIDIYEGWIVEFQDDVNNIYKQLKHIDDRNIFEKDDDVGFVFSDILGLIKKFNERTNFNANQEKE